MKERKNITAQKIKEHEKVIKDELLLYGYGSNGSAWNFKLPLSLNI
jgi:hypothetical protein